MTDANAKVILYKVANKLIKKIGFNHPNPEEGGIDPKSIEKAEKIIETLCENCRDNIKSNLDKLNQCWIEMRDMPDCEERTALSKEIFTFAHEIKDIASLCGYSLCAYFAESLRDYIEKTDPNFKSQRIIVQAHIDAMIVVHKQDLKEDGGPAADELKDMVKVAIQKYS